MGLVKMQCPNCGANFDMNDKLEYGVCNFCGTKVMIDKTIVEHRGTVSIKGVADAEALLDRAQLFIEDANFEEACRYCERVLDLNPRNHDAYILKLLAQTHCKSRTELGSLSKPLYTYDSYQKAIRFAPEEVKQQLTEYNTQTIHSFEKKKTVKLSEIARLENTINNRKQEENNALFWTKSFKASRIAVIIISIVITLLLIAGNSGGWSIIGLVLMIAGLVFLNIMYDKGNRFLTEQNQLIDKCNQQKAQYADWLNMMQNVIS